MVRLREISGPGDVSMKTIILIPIIILILVYQNASLAGVLSGGIQDLEGKRVVHAGPIQTFECTTPGKYDCSTWPKNLLKFEYKNICFETGTDVCSIGCEGLIAIGEDNRPYFYTNGGYLEGIRKYSVDYYKCPL